MKFSVIFTDLDTGEVILHKKKNLTPGISSTRAELLRFVDSFLRGCSIGRHISIGIFFEPDVQPKLLDFK